MVCLTSSLFLFFFNDTATTEIYTLSLHDALPISFRTAPFEESTVFSSIGTPGSDFGSRSEEHTSELQSLTKLVCRLLLEKKKNTRKRTAWNSGAWNTATRATPRAGKSSRKSGR